MREHNIYLFDLPLLLVIVSLVYSATRYDQWGPILRQALRWGVNLVVFLGCIVGVLWVLTRI
jgi:hypothetical protein